MAMVEINKVKKEFGEELLFKDVTFSIEKKDRIALIGNNGTGKTTLIKMILKQMEIDGGSINVSNGTTIGYLSQGVITNLDHTLYQEMLLSFKEVIRIKEKVNDILKKLENDPLNENLLNEYGKYENYLSNNHGYDYEYLIDLMISRFGFSKEDYDKPISSFSGGEKSKIAFSKLLLDSPSLLILDEPTNHLDVNTIEWLEDYLLDYQGAILLVSHDRFFIDCICSKIVEIDNKVATSYNGNYTFYLEQKALHYEQMLAKYNHEQEQIKKLQELIKKFMPHPTKTSFAHDREKKLARIQKNAIDKPKLEHQKVKFSLNKEEVRRVRQLTLENIEVGYTSKLNNAFSYTVFSGDKIAILGDNGCGKTTMIKSICNMLPFLSGRVVKHRELRIGYYDQNQIYIEGNENVFDNFHNAFPYMDNFQIRSQLAKFLFYSDDLEKSVQSLSGGEKAKLSFAKLLVKNYDILVLDEPTNHLDLETKRVHEEALSSYNGTIIFVSHDRFFVDEIANHVFIFNNKNVEIHEGNYSSYRINKEKTKSEEKEIKEEKVKKEKVVKPKNISPLKVEKELTTKQEQLDKLKKEYQDDANCDNYILLEELHEKITKLESEIQELEEIYLSFLE